jgi:hypothetical protein
VQLNSLLTLCSSAAHHINSLESGPACVQTLATFFSSAFCPAMTATVSVTMVPVAEL